MVMAALTLMVGLQSCTEADVAKANLDKAADSFEVYRRVVFYNGITDKYILQLEGNISITNYGGQLVAIVKTDNGTFLKHNLGLSDNVTYFSEQLHEVPVSSRKYRVIFKPSAIVPNIDIQ